MSLEGSDRWGMEIGERFAGGSGPPVGLGGHEFRLMLLLGILPLGLLGVFLGTSSIGGK